MKSLLLLAVLAVPAAAQDSTAAQRTAAATAAAARRAYLDSLPTNTVRLLVKRLELEKYKETLRGLAQFGDRRQGTERNRKAVDWIEAQLDRKSTRLNSSH